MKMWNINAPHGRIPCAIFTKFTELVRLALVVKTSLDLLTWLWSYGGFKLAVSIYPKFWAPPSGETMRQTPKRFGGARTCSGSSITIPSLVGLRFHPPPRWPKTLSFFVCLSICLFVTLLNVRLCARFRHEGVGVQKRFWCLLDRRRFVVMRPCWTFSDCYQLATTLNAEVQKTAKIRVFRQQRATE